MNSYTLSSALYASSVARCLFATSTIDISVSVGRPNRLGAGQSGGVVSILFTQIVYLKNFQYTLWISVTKASDGSRISKMRG